MIYSGVNAETTEEEIKSPVFYQERAPAAPRREVKRRKRRGKQLDIADKLQNLLTRTHLGTLPESCFQNCVQNKSRNPRLKRSSKYVGVSRNGDNWQTLINDGSGKKYVGTFATEEEAGLAYDLYALALQGPDHKTNFSYTAQTVAEMAESYLLSGGQFEPSLFLNKRLN